MPAADTARLVAELTLKDKMSKGINSAATSLGRLDKATSRTQRSLGTLGGNLQKGVVLGAAAAAGGFVAVVNSARDFESAFAGVRKTVDATEPELNALSAAIRQMSREIPISAVELAGLGEAAGALGIAKGDIQEFIRVTALIGVTTDVAAGDAATALGTLSNILGLVGKDYDNFAATLVDLGNKGASTESQILAFTERIAGAGKLIGLSAADVLGFSAALANAGLEAEAGGTAISRFFLESFKDVSQGGKDLKLLAKLAGTTAKTFQKAFKKDAAGALEDVLVGLGKLNEAQRLAAIEALGFKDVRIRDTLLRLTGDTDNLTNSLNTSATAWKDNTALTKEAEQRFKTFDSQLQITKNVLNDMGITIGSKLLPKLTPLLQKLNAFVSENQGKIEEFGTKLAAGFDEFATAVGKVDWQPFIDGLRITSDIAKGAIGLFMSLPPEVQKIAIAGLAVNKLTGGLASSIVKDLAGLALGSLKTITAANVTVIGANVTGGGLPGGAAGAAGGGITAAGILKGGIKFVLPIGIGVLLANAIREAAGITPEEAAKQNSLGQFGPRSQANANAVQNVKDKDAAAKLAALQESAVRDVASSERLEAMFGPKVTEAAKLGVVATERAEARAAQNAAAVIAASQQGVRATERAEQTASQKVQALIAATVSTGATEAASIRLASSAQTAAAARVKTAVDADREASRQGFAGVRSSVDRKKWQFITNLAVSTRVSVRETIEQQTTYKQYFKTAS